MWTIEDPHIKAVAESMALSAAQAWVMNRRMVQSINDLVEMVREARPDPQVK
jgi:5-methylthioribose kinase